MLDLNVVPYDNPCEDCTHSIICKHKEIVESVKTELTGQLPESLKTMITVTVDCKHRESTIKIQEQPITRLAFPQNQNMSPLTTSTALEMINETKSGETLNIVQTSHVRGTDI